MSYIFDEYSFIYLVQRGRINKPTEIFKNLKLSEAVDLDYMGSAEFEFGALPASLREIEANAKKVTLREIPEIVDSTGRNLWLFSYLSDSEFELYLKQLIKIFNGTSTNRPKGGMRGFSSKPSLFESSNPMNFWWDIGHQVMFSFEKKFMQECLLDHLASSLNYMNAVKRG